MPLFGLPESVVPVCHRVQRDELFLIHRLMGPCADLKSLDDVIEAFHKAWQFKKELRP
jgi:hypothetical protein